MRKFSLGLLLVLLTAVFIPVAISSDIEKGYISVNISESKEITPDIAEISFAVKTFDSKSMQKASNDNRTISDKVLTELKSMINPSNGDYVKTSDYSASPVYTYKDSKKYLDKYEVSNRVIVRTKSIDKLGYMIDKAISLGATNVDSLNFSVSNYENYCNDLLSSASDKAYKRASVVAKSVGSSLNGVKSFDTSCNANNNSSNNTQGSNSNGSGNKRSDTKLL